VTNVARVLGAAATTVGLVLVVVTLHLHARGAESVAASDEALARGDTLSAIAWARDAAMATAPWSERPAEGYARLAAIAASAEERGDFDLATDAWRATLAAVTATRAEVTESARKDAAVRALVRLSARTCEENQARPPADCAAAAKELLAQAPLPSTERMSWLGVGGVAFFGCGAFAAQAKERRARAFALAVSLAGLAVATVTLVTR
jgi:hypothetical protein